MSVLTLVAIVVAAAGAALAYLVHRREQRRSDARVAALAHALDAAAAGAALEGRERELFHSGGPDREAWPLRLGIAGAAAALVLAAGISSTAGDGAAAAPLELLSMGHERAGAALVVSGRVLQVAPAVDEVQADMFALDGEGRTAARAAAPLVFAADRTAAFRITIPEVPHATRYRVGFRASSGAVRHVDRRARTQTASGTAAGR